MNTTTHTRTRFGAFWRLTRLNKPIGIFLVVWPMLWALWLAARGTPNAWVLLVFVLGAVLMRSAGCVINTTPIGKSMATSSAPRRDRWLPARSARARR